MRAFVTGASGYIGMAVARAFRRSGASVFGLARSVDSASRLERHEIEPVLGDLKDVRTLADACRRAEVIVHCAADSSRDRGEIDRRATEAMMLYASEAEGNRTFLYTSGCWVYGDTAGEAAHEGSPLSPAALVTWRPAVEQLVLERSSEQLSAVVLRPACVYGGSGGLTGDWFDTARREGAARIVGTGHNHWAMIHVEDLAAAYIQVVAHGLRQETLNLADGSQATVREMAEAAATAVDAGGRVTCGAVSTPFGEALALDQRLDCSKAQRLLAWQPRFHGFLDQVSTYARAWKSR